MIGLRFKCACTVMSELRQKKQSVNQINASERKKLKILHGRVMHLYWKIYKFTKGHREIPVVFS